VAGRGRALVSSRVFLGDRGGQFAETRDLAVAINAIIIAIFAVSIQRETSPYLG